MKKQPVKDKKKVTNISRSKRVTEADNRHGMRLISWLWETADDRGLTHDELAKELGITYGYLAALKNGFSRNGISSNFARSCAQFLKVPVINVLMAADQIALEDFLDPRIDPEVEVNKALKIIKSDKKWGVFVPDTITRQNSKYKQLVVLLYEAATGKILIPDKIDMQSIKDSIKPPAKTKANRTRALKDKG